MAAQKKMRGAHVKVNIEDSFFEHEETSMFMTWLLSTSITKKKLYFMLSLLLCLFQTAVLAVDTVYHFHLKNHHFFSYSNIEAILVLQVVSFYWSILATTYSFQRGNRKLGYVSLLSVFLNLSVFAARCGYEFMMMKFRVEEF